MDFSIKGERVVEVVQEVSRHRGVPARIQVDNGSEFISKALDLWAYQQGVTLDFSRPGRPTDNPFIESFNGSFRDECLNTHWFLSLDDAAEKIEKWRVDYNDLRPHSSLENLAPSAFRARIAPNLSPAGGSILTRTGFWDRLTPVGGSILTRTGFWDRLKGVRHSILR